MQACCVGLADVVAPKHSLMSAGECSLRPQGRACTVSLQSQRSIFQLQDLRWVSLAVARTLLWHGCIILTLITILFACMLVCACIPAFDCTHASARLCKSVCADSKGLGETDPGKEEEFLHSTYYINERAGQGQKCKDISLSFLLHRQVCNLLWT